MSGGTTVRWATAAWLGALALAVTAVAGEPPDVRRPLGGGAEVNWTRLEVEVVGVGIDPTLKVDTKPLEQIAISSIDARVGDDCARVPVRAGERLGAVAPRVTLDALNSWSIREGRYHAHGPVEIIGVVSLQPLLAPWMKQRSVPGPPISREGPTGVLIDARGQTVQPTYAPRVLGAGGEVLYDSVLWEDVAFLRAPVVWVSDPAHSEARRAGDTPAFFMATARGADLILSAEDTARFLAEIAPTRMLGDGGVVVVVDP
jgi:hypothetical protein